MTFTLGPANNKLEHNLKYTSTLVQMFVNKHQTKTHCAYLFCHNCSNGTEDVLLITFTMYFHYFIIVIPWWRAWHFARMFFLHVCLVPSLVKILKQFENGRCLKTVVQTKTKYGKYIVSVRTKNAQCHLTNCDTTKFQNAFI